MAFAPLPLLDDFLLPYNVGQVLLVVFVLTMLASLPLRSRKVLSINALLFGFVFMLTPSSAAPIEFRFLGIALVVVGPMLYVTAKR